MLIRFRVATSWIMWEFENSVHAAVSARNNRRQINKKRLLERLRSKRQQNSEQRSLEF